MTSIDLTSAQFRIAPKARPFDVDDYGDFDPTQHGTQSPASTRLGVTLFWAAVVCLIAARVFLFDPAAKREVGSFPDQIAPTFQSR